MALDTRAYTELLSRVGLALAVAALAGTLLVSAGGFLLVRLGLRPLRDLVDQTRQLAADTLHRRLDGSAQPEELEPLIARPGRVLSRVQLEEKLYGWKDDVSSNAVEVYIHGVRKKLGAGLIQNVRGVGYMVPRAPGT